MSSVVNATTLEQLFLNARSYNDWQMRDVPLGVLNQLWDLVKMAPTSANCSPLRVVFITSPEAKKRLKPMLSEGNVAKTLAAPITAILATDYAFYEKLPYLFPHADAQSWFKGQPHSDSTAFRNASIQGGYFILAARALGLDCGPMSGFDNKKLDDEFFPHSTVQSNFLVNLGYGDPQSLFSRSPRLSFAEACQII